MLPAVAHDLQHRLAAEQISAPFRNAGVVKSLNTVTPRSWSTRPYANETDIFVSGDDTAAHPRNRPQSCATVWLAGIDLGGITRSRAGAWLLLGSTDGPDGLTLFQPQLIPSGSHWTSLHTPRRLPAVHFIKWSSRVIFWGSRWRPTARPLQSVRPGASPPPDAFKLT